MGTPAVQHVAPDSPPTSITSAGVLDLRAAPELASALLAQRGEAVVLDGADVRQLGGQCLQVLLSAQATWAADGRSFQVVAASEEFAASATLLGATGLLADA